MKDKSLVRNILARLDASPPEDHTDILDLPVDAMHRELLAAGFSPEMPQSLRAMISGDADAQSPPRNLQEENATEVDKLASRSEGNGISGPTQGRAVDGSPKYRKFWPVAAALAGLAASIAILIGHLQLQYEVTALRSSLTVDVQMTTMLIDQIAGLKKDLQAAEAKDRANVVGLSEELISTRANLAAQIAGLSQRNEKLQRDYKRLQYAGLSATGLYVAGGSFTPLTSSPSYIAGTFSYPSLGFANEIQSGWNGYYFTNGSQISGGFGPDVSFVSPKWAVTTEWTPVKNITFTHSGLNLSGDGSTRNFYFSPSLVSASLGMWGTTSTLP